MKKFVLFLVSLICMVVAFAFDNTDAATVAAAGPLFLSGLDIDLQRLRVAVAQAAQRAGSQYGTVKAQSVKLFQTSEALSDTASTYTFDLNSQSNGISDAPEYKLRPENTLIILGISVGVSREEKDGSGNSMPGARRTVHYPDKTIFQNAVIQKSIQALFASGRYTLTSDTINYVQDDPCQKFLVAPQTQDAAATVAQTAFYDYLEGTNGRVIALSGKSNNVIQFQYNNTKCTPATTTISGTTYQNYLDFLILGIEVQGFSCNDSTFTNILNDILLQQAGNPVRVNTQVVR